MQLLTQVEHLSLSADVDDLEEIGNLPMYVAASQCVLIFLSKGYFASKNWCAIRSN